MPKAGVHLMGKLLEHLNIHYSGFFLANDHLIKDQNSFFGDNRYKEFFFKENSSFFSSNCIKNITPTQYLPILSDDTFSLSHLTPRDIPFYMIPEINVILLVRRLKESLISAFNAEMILFETQRKSCIFEHIISINDTDSIEIKFKKYLKNYCSRELGFYIDMMYWVIYNNTLLVRFEELASESLFTRKSLYTKISKELGKTDVFKDYFYTNTSTYNSKKRITIDFWSSEHDDILEEYNWNYLSNWIDKSFYQS